MLKRRMYRMSIKKPLTLDDLIPQYALNKQEFDSYKKLCDEENKQIKELMVSQDIKEAFSGPYKVTYSVARKETINEDRLLAKLDTAPESVKQVVQEYGIIKTKPYIDFDALEKALYAGDFEDVDIVASCKEVKETPTLRLSKIVVKEHN
jgi:hypothetical protein